MSIAVIVDTFPRWSERFIARELNELKYRGAKLSIYCLRAGDEECAKDPEFADLIQHRVVLPTCFIPTAARELGMDDAAKKRKALVEAEFGLTGFRQIGCANSLVKLLREHKHSVVYAHFASLPSTLGWLAAEALSLPLVISAHARDVHVEAQLLTEKIRYARHFFTCNQKALNVLLAAEIKTPVEHKVSLMRHGLPLKYFPFTPRKTPQPGHEFKLLAAGRFVRKKGFNDLIDSFSQPELKDAPMSLTIIGDGPERKALETQVSKAGLPKRIRLPGSVQDAELRKYFDESDALIVPSVTANDGDIDGVPNVVLEAFALGLPVFGTVAGSLGDVLNARTGTVFLEHDPSSLARALRRFMDDPTEALGRAGVARVLIEDRYNIKRNIVPLARVLGLPVAMPGGGLK